MNGALAAPEERIGGELNHAAPSVAVGLPILTSAVGSAMVERILPTVELASSVPPLTPVASQPLMGAAAATAPTVTELMKTPAIRMVRPLPVGLVRDRWLAAAATPGISSWL